jgi:phosphoribosylformimino-5-aminoimidazole carboxamide ribotide isomerase
MDLILAVDLKGGKIVHGRSGNREQYQPIVSPLASGSDPFVFLQDIRPRYLYVADLDRITGSGSHDAIIPLMAASVDLLLLDRGSRSPEDQLDLARVITIIGTETAGDLHAYSGGYLSVDMKDRKVLPDQADPLDLLHQASACSFDGCILLDIGGVGTLGGLDKVFLDQCRSAYPSRLMWGGGVAKMADLFLLRDCGFDGAIIATALHSGSVPLDLIRGGQLC